MRGTYTSKKDKIIINVPGIGIKDIFGRKRVPYHFIMNPSRAEIISKESKRLTPAELPKFNIEVHIDNINCDINQAFDGYCIVHECSLPIKSIELQFMRKELIFMKGIDGLKEASEIQNLQIGDGDVNKEMEIPLFMLFPKVFSCATMETPEAKISFEMNVVIVLVNGIIIVDNFPVNTWRS